MPGKSVATTVKPVWFPLYVQDFLASPHVAVMTTEAIGAYILMLMTAWNDATCSLPNDDEALARITRLGERWSQVKIQILPCFIVRENRLVNSRLLLERAKAAAIVSKCSKAGTMSSLKRWKASSKSAESNAKVTSVTSMLVHGDNQSQSQSQSLHDSPRDTMSGPDGHGPSSLNWEAAERVLKILNVRSGHNFPSRMGNRRTKGLTLIAERLRSSEESILVAVVEDRVHQWKDDSRMRQYLRPDTIFRASNFEQYVGMIPRSTLTCRRRIAGPNHTLRDCGQPIVTGKTVCLQHVSTSVAKGGFIHERSVTPGVISDDRERATTTST